MSACSVCEKRFTARDDFDFICQPCRDTLRHCGCGQTDDIQIDWNIVTDSELGPYIWTIECMSCGAIIRSRPHKVDQTDSVAKEIHRAWLAMNGPSQL